MRTAISPTDLALLVGADLEHKVNSNVTFTAYDTTTALRANHPGIDTLHEDVRSIVHSLMEAIVLTGAYQRTLESYPAGDAWTYSSTLFPATAAPAPLLPTFVPGPLQIPTLTPRLSWLPNQIPDDEED